LFFNEEQDWGFAQFMKLELLLASKEDFLTNDTLIVQVHICKIVDPEEQNVKDKAKEEEVNEKFSTTKLRKRSLLLKLRKDPK